jgi:hypothetical protein
MNGNLMGWKLSEIRRSNVQKSWTTDMMEKKGVHMNETFAERHIEAS